MIGSSDPTPAHTGQRMRAASPGRPVISPLTVPVGVGPWFGAQHVERRVADAPHPVGVGEQRHAARQHLLRVSEPAPAVDVEGQGHVPQLGEGVGPPALDVVDPRPLGPEQDRGPAVDTGGEREVPDHRQAIGRVLDRTRRHRRHEARR
jgi:hypothetical protein